MYLHFILCTQILSSIPTTETQSNSTVMAKNPNPTDPVTFIKGIGCDHEGFLKIPDEFKRNFLTPLPRHFTVSTNDGKLWIMAIMSYKGTAYLASGWKIFRTQYALCRGDHVIMTFDRESHFKVIVFMKNGLEKYFQGEELLPGMDPYHHWTNRSRLNTIPATNGKYGDDYTTDDEEQSEAVATALLNETLLADEGIPHPLEEEDFVEMGEVEMRARYGDHVPHCYIIVKEINLMAPFEMVVDLNTLKFVNFSRVLVRHKDDDHSHLYLQKLPTDFARSELTPGLQAINLKRTGYGTWPIVCCMDGDKGNIMEGWKEFAQANEVKEYDQIAFERNRLDVNVWNVTVFRNGRN